MIKLNGVELSPDLIWSNEFGDIAISQQQSVTVLGNKVINTLPIQGCREVTLSSVRSGSSMYGYYTRTQIQQIKELERSGTVVNFIYETQSFNVVVQAGSIDVAPLLAKANQGYDDYYTGSITLLEV